MKRKPSLQIKESLSLLSLFPISCELGPILKRTTTPWGSVHNGKGRGRGTENRDDFLFLSEISNLQVDYFRKQCNERVRGWHSVGHNTRQ
jgi:hypothetical protein